MIQYNALGGFNRVLETQKGVSTGSSKRTAAAAATVLLPARCAAILAYSECNSCES
jgi:hypothetical protein